MIKKFFIVSVAMVILGNAIVLDSGIITEYDLVVDCLTICALAVAVVKEIKL